MMKNAFGETRRKGGAREWVKEGEYRPGVGSVHNGLFLMALAPYLTPLCPRQNPAAWKAVAYERVISKTVWLH